MTPWDKFIGLLKKRLQNKFPAAFNALKGEKDGLMYYAHPGSYHPQTDGQTERSYRILKEMVRCYCDEFTNTWDDKLVVLEFAYNNSYQSSIKSTPFYVNQGRHPALPTTVALGLEDDTTATNASQLIQTMASARYATKHYMEVARARQAKYANTKRKALPLKVRDEVLLATNRLKMNGESFKKLQPR